MTENLYEEIYNFDNLFEAWKSAKKGKSKKRYVKRFGNHLEENLNNLSNQLKNKTYKPHKLKTFILRDPKTRKISKSAFRDRIVHLAICRIIMPDIEKQFIYDSYANLKRKGTLKAIERFDQFKRKVSKNGHKKTYVLKADIKHYFEEIRHDILIEILEEKIRDYEIIDLIKVILDNYSEDSKGIPLGNLTSQSFANIYLDKLDQFVKNKLRAKYYIRYVDDFVILHNSKNQLTSWKNEIDKFLRKNLEIELHPDKSQILKLEKGIKFLGFRFFPNHRLLRKSNMNHFERKFNQMKIQFKEGILTRDKSIEKLEGWIAYAKHGNTYNYRKKIIQDFNKSFPADKKNITNKKRHYNFIKKFDESELEFSTQKTLFLFCKGKSVKEIAEIREMKESTIWNHISNFIEHKQLSIYDVLPKEKVAQILKRIYSKKDKITDIKKRLKDDSISFDKISCVMSSIKSHNKNPKK